MWVGGGSRLLVRGCDSGCAVRQAGGVGGGRSGGAVELGGERVAGFDGELSLRCLGLVGPRDNVKALLARLVVVIRSRELFAGGHLVGGGMQRE